jgi:hypothetical protein
MAVTLLCAGELPDGEGTRLRQRLTVLRAKHAADRTLLAQSDEAGTDVLAQTPVARDVAAAAHTVANASGSTPLLAPALDAALMDEALSESLEAATPNRFGIAQDKSIAYVLGEGAQFPDLPDMPDGMTFELLRSLDAPIALRGETGGVAVVTASNWSASAEAVGVVARSASLAQLCATAIEKTVSRPDGELSPEVVWDALGDGARAASALRSAGLLKSAVLTFRGRGRAIGPVEGDRLLRFGVSSWR